MEPEFSVYQDWHLTNQIRWFKTIEKKKHWWDNTNTYVRLQQLWRSDRGAEDWRDIPVVRVEK